MREYIVEIFFLRLLMTDGLADKNLSEAGEYAGFCKSALLSFFNAVGDYVKVIALSLKLFDKLLCTSEKISTVTEIA